MPRTRSCRSQLGLASMVLVGGFVLCGSLASACTVPVFRYALERWESDRFLVIVYHAGQLTAEQDLAISELAQRSSLVGGPLNIEILRYDVTAPLPSKFLDVQAPPADRPLPWVEICSRDRGTRMAVRWQGPLAELDQPGLFDSPARSEIVRRMLKGDSAVWLLVTPEEQLPGLSEKLRTMLDDAAPGLTLPQGIGLPGSELYAAIPLEIRFSVLPVSHTDAKEQIFLKMIAASAAEWRSDTAYVIPVFGRCRALEVFPYADASEALIEDVGNFLCAACSCRVKQANPGFDLLASANWDERLFGESIPQELRIAAQTNGAIGSSGLPSAPEFLAIPAGNQPARDAEPTATTQQAQRPIEADQAIKSQSTAFDGPIDVTTFRHTPNWTKLLLLLVSLSLISGGILTGVIYLWRSPG